MVVVMVGEEKMRAATLYNVLVQVLQERVIMTFRVTEPQNGYKAVRKLAENAMSPVPARSLTSDHTILAWVLRHRHAGETGCV